MRTQYKLLPSQWQEIGGLVERISRSLCEGTREQEQIMGEYKNLFPVIYAVVLRYELEHLQIENARGSGYERVR